MTSSKVAAIDVHKKGLVVIVVEVGAEELSHDGRRFGTTTDELAHLVAWLQGRGVQDVVLESTAQYWKPVWLELEPHFRLHLAQAQSNRAPRGRKYDFGDARRLGRRFLAGELILSYVPEPTQRSWRTVTRTKYQLTRERVRLQSPVGVPAGRGAHQTIQRGERSAGAEWATHPAGYGERRNRSGETGRVGRSAVAV
jgi:transposase